MFYDIEPTDRSPEFAYGGVTGVNFDTKNELYTNLAMGLTQPSGLRETKKAAPYIAIKVGRSEPQNNEVDHLHAIANRTTSQTDAPG